MSQFWNFPREARAHCIEQVVLPRISGGGFTVSSKIESGYSSDIYVLHGTQVFPSSLVVKTPKIEGCTSREVAAARIKSFEQEIELTCSFCTVAWSQHYQRVEYFLEWPFAIARKRDGTLRDLIENSAAWSVAEKLIVLIQIARGIAQCVECGLAAHQDLKPENIFFDDLRRVLSGTLPLRVYIADFGAANGVMRSPRRNYGSRPYMAPEQYRADLIPDPYATDVFAVGVIAYEILTDGEHPSGVRTADVWPAQTGRYARENYWKYWARSGSASRNIPGRLGQVLKSAMSPEPVERPSLRDIESALWAELELCSDKARDYKLLIDAFEGMYFENGLNGYMADWIERRARLQGS